MKGITGHPVALHVMTYAMKDSYNQKLFKSSRVEPKNCSSPPVNFFFLLVPLALQNDVCAEFSTRSLFSYSSAGGGKFLCAHLKSEF